MTDAAHISFDAAEYAVAQALAAWQAVLEATPDDLAHTAARNRIVRTLESLDDAAMYGQRARALVQQVTQD